MLINQKNSIKAYLAIARPSHWFKNIFVLPGVAIAALLTHTPLEYFMWKLFVGLLSTCFIASANYVMNEWLDAEFDRFHPVKKNRPSVIMKLKASIVYIEYSFFAACGLFLAALVSTHFLITSVVFLATGILYNMKPFRTKDRAYLDVFSESVNNPIRLLLGWFLVTHHPIPPSSLILGYWAGGAYLMSIKRYAEFRFIGNPEVAKLYRHSFGYYTEKRLLISSFFYAMCSSFFLGVFLIKYRLELLFSLPFFAILFTWYLYMGLKPESPVQYPERLYREKKFMIYVVFLVSLVSVLLVCDIPLLRMLLENAFILKN